MEDNRRGGLVARVQVEGDRTFEGRVDDVLVGAGACQLVVGFRVEHPQLAVGGSIDLELGGAWLALPVASRGLVVSRREEGDEEVYQFELPGDGSESSGDTLGREESLRVRPEGEVPVEVRSSGKVLQGQLEELSTSGAAVLVTSDAEVELGQATRVRLVFSLHGEEEEFDPVGDIRGRSLHGSDGSMVRLDLDLLAPTGERQTAMSAGLAGYVKARQTEMLRRLLS